MEIQLSDHFTYSKLLRFTLPSIMMMVFSSIYGVVDGFFVSNFVGKTPFAAINLIMPFLMIFGAIGFMIGTGGSALVSKTLGEDNKAKANEIFSLLIYVMIIVSLVVTTVGLIFLEPISKALGADEKMLSDCIAYGRIILPALTAYMLQNAFQSFLVTAERPKLGLTVTVGAGVMNVVLDTLFIIVFRWGVAGAALATAASQLIGGLIPLVYFIMPNKSTLRLGKAKRNVGALFKACTNGASEFMTNISMSIVNICYNFQLMRIAGADGVAAYGVIMYVNFIFLSVFLGYSIGSAPIVGFHYGAVNHNEMKNLLRKSLTIVGLLGIALTVLAELAAKPLALIFVSYDTDLLAMTIRGFMLYSASFLLAGFNIYTSSFFTALNNGAVSAVISFLRTLPFQISAVMILPIFLELDGIWLAIVVAEVLSLTISVGFLFKMKTKYHYN
jgi:putative MATE family efflux protein